jgi:hypothetical protein
MGVVLTMIKLKSFSIDCGNMGYAVTSQQQYLDNDLQI